MYGRYVSWLLRDACVIICVLAVTWHVCVDILSIGCCETLVCGYHMCISCYEKRVCGHYVSCPLRDTCAWALCALAVTRHVCV